MNFPSLPTDNLYKFSAIFGLLITVISAYFPYTKIGPLKQQQIQIETELNVLSAVFAGISPELDRIKAEKQKIPLETWLRSWQRITEVETKRAEIHGKNQQLMIMAYEIRLLAYLGTIGVVFGFVMFSMGVYFWATRVQKYQDMIIRHQASSAQRHITTPSSGRGKRRRPA
jgi:hypothetical protein